MKGPFVLLLLTILGALGCYSQKLRKVSAEYTYYAAETMSVDEAKHTALDRAKIQAIADEFGTIVSQSTATIICNRNGKSDSQFFSFGGSDIKGEWIETIGEPQYSISFADHNLIVTCTVQGKAREISSARIDFIANSLRNGTDLRFESTEFKDGDNLYLYFKSPVDGYLAVYLLEEATHEVYCILPYKNSDRSEVAVDADKDYILFSIPNAPKETRQLVDEYQLNCDNEKEYYDLYVLFSIRPFGKAKMDSQSHTFLLKTTSYTEFNKWLVRSRKNNNDLLVQRIPIWVSK